MVPGKHVRPTTDRVKESLFNVLGPFFEGGQALDLFAGTGALGIEAISRGIQHAVFVDKSPISTKVIRDNVKKVKFDQRVEIHTCDAGIALRKLKERKLKFDLIFMDPPYYDGLMSTLLDAISQYGLLSEDGMVVTEHAKEYTMPERANTLTRSRTLTYGNTWMSLYHLQKG
jgi:16S rRNA (guanine(966)-N(2))-methyltransferase RsmD